MYSGIPATHTVSEPYQMYFKTYKLTNINKCIKPKIRTVPSFSESNGGDDKIFLEKREKN